MYLYHLSLTYLSFTQSSIPASRQDGCVAACCCVLCDSFHHRSLGPAEGQAEKPLPPSWSHPSSFPRYGYNHSTLIVLTYVGNALLFAKPHEFFISTCNEVYLKWESIMKISCKLVGKYGPIIRLHLGPRPNVVITTAEAFEKILNSNQHITKVKACYWNMIVNVLSRGETILSCGPGLVLGS